MSNPLDSLLTWHSISKVMGYIYIFYFSLSPEESEGGGEGGGFFFHLDGMSRPIHSLRKEFNRCSLAFSHLFFSLLCTFWYLVVVALPPSPLWTPYLKCHQQSSIDPHNSTPSQRCVSKWLAATTTGTHTIKRICRRRRLSTHDRYVEWKCQVFRQQNTPEWAKKPRWIHSEKDLNVLTRISLDFSKVFVKEFESIYE